MALALYRRYRPDTFDGVIGQDQVTIPLSRALDQGKITHAYLFSGPRGCGKTSSARILARCINCEKGPTSHPCGECQSCKDLATGGAGSIDVVEIDAASHNGVDDARELRERAGFAPARDRYKIFILDEAHMVTQQGFNALLKIVEEPPEHVMFIFATTEPDKVIGTIRSRTHHYPFRLVPPEVMSPYLEDICKKEGILPQPGVLRLVMRAGAGSMRDTLSVLDQLMVGAVDGSISLDSAVALLGFTPNSLISEFIDDLINHDGASIYDVVRRVIVGGYDTRKFVEDLLGRVRDLLLMVSAGPKAASSLLNDVSPEDLEILNKQSASMTLHDLARMAQTINDALSAMASAISPRMNLEILVARLLADSETSNTVATNLRINNVQQQNISTSKQNIQNKVSSGAHFVGSTSNKKYVSADSENNSTSNSSLPSETTASPIAKAETQSATNTKETESKKVFLNDAHNANSKNDSMDTDAMWDKVVSKLPDDVREYVTREYVPTVQLTSAQSGRQRLILTFNEPMSQHAFALAVCTTSPYDGQKVPKVVMNEVHEIFGTQVMIAPAPVAANGEQVESVARMDPQKLAKVKRDILLRKTGISAGFSNKTDSDSSGINKNPTKKESSGFSGADGSAASVASENTADELSDVANADDDVWADMSSMPMSDVIAMPENSSSEESSSKGSSIEDEPMNHDDEITIQKSSHSHNQDEAISGVLDQDKLQSQVQNATNTSELSAESIQTTVSPTNGATADECSMDDASLESATSVSTDELKQIFEVKSVEEFASTDPKNPKNAIMSVKKKQEE
ncbi:DNA polymerase III subunit gamma/tau [Gardnerella leopoldii]|uniref:DNA polymerase III subunit gamma/tau n=1 Tax=Gardnerella leopoldii TaxID=2792978 RepID=UPI003970C140